jgi:tetratricopeptide (TPR) repeat protein
VTHSPPRAPHRTLALLATLVAASLAPPVHAAVAKPAPRTFDIQAALQIVRQAREFEDRNAYSLALAQWRRLRSLAPIDGDLELAVALDEARVGQLDSAAVRLAGPTLSAAALDTLPQTRFRSYTVEREGVYVNGVFDGWHWYVWRARAEVAAARGRWDEATAAAHRGVAARPASGKEWLLLALCAAHAGAIDEAHAALERAITLDVTVPEAHYLAGLLAWREGRKTEAQTSFRAAVAADSTASEPAMALVRSRLSGAAPDSLPTAFLTGKRAVAMLTSSAGPKLEEFLQIEQAAILAHREDPVVPASLTGIMTGQRIPLWLFIDEDGRVILNDLPWSSGIGYPTAVISELLKDFSHWRFLPAKVRGEPRATWVDLQYAFPR